MSPKLSRFLHLEKDRSERSKREQPSQLQDGGRRFEDIAERGAMPQGDVPEAHLERFKAETPVVLEPRAASLEEAWDFPRCVVCASDNGRYSKHCQQCGADLGTPQQLEHRARLALERREARAREQGEERQGALERLEQERRADSERYAYLLEKLRAEEQSYRGWRIFARHSTVGTGLLALLPNTLTRCLAVAGCVGVCAGLMRFGTGNTRVVGAWLLIVFVLLFVPRSALRHRWRLR
ncbi:hypothetical protein [Myxococcus sp. AB025B]|uniref:hypothetical protein n=1 Tax=Myxococcus TaxID=32 RepID=UPI001144151D|nr:hypothetical protein [Myxococcus sp. AB025B]